MNNQVSEETVKDLSYTRMTVHPVRPKNITPPEPPPQPEESSPPEAGASNQDGETE